MGQTQNLQKLKYQLLLRLQVHLLLPIGRFDNVFNVLVFISIKQSPEFFRVECELDSSMRVCMCHLPLQVLMWTYIQFTSIPI